MLNFKPEFTKKFFFFFIKMYQEVLHALKLLYICIRYLIEECPLLLWGDYSLSDIVRLVNEHLYFLHIYTSNHLLFTYTICYPFKGRRQYKSWNLCPPRLVKKNPIWSNLSNLILYSLFPKEIFIERFKLWTSYSIGHFDSSTRWHWNGNWCCFVILFITISTLIV